MTPLGSLGGLALFHITHIWRHFFPNGLISKNLCLVSLCVVTNICLLYLYFTLDLGRRGHARLVVVTNSLTPGPLSLAPQRLENIVAKRGI